MGSSTRSDRAKIFMPFDALSGFREALQKEERVTVPKIELSEEKLEELDYKLHLITGHPVLTVVYYSIAESSYLKVTGKLAKIDPTARILQIVNLKICFEDIRDISFPDNFEF